MIKRKDTKQFKFSQDILNDQPHTVAKTIEADISKPGSTYNRGKLYRPFDPRTLKMGWNADDFAKDLVTVTCDRRVYTNVPRILRAIYREEKYKPRHRHRSIRRKHTIIYKSPRIIKEVTITEVSILPGGGHGIGFNFKQ